jgi:hypothetical protein
LILKGSYKLGRFSNDARDYFFIFLANLMGENLSDCILLAPSDKGMLSVSLSCWFGVIFLIFGGFSIGVSIFVALVV